MLIDQIARETGLSGPQILEIARCAPYSYRTYTIPKRSGGGVRVISHPSRKLKVLQRWLADRVLIDLPIHDLVYSYRRGKSIRDNADLHKNANYLLRVDLKDFFPSISRVDVTSLLRLHKTDFQIPVSDEDISFVARVVCKGNAITIGAPSSPVISNAVLYNFDVKVTELSTKYAVTYTRYADDLYFSTCLPNVLTTLLAEVKAVLQTLPFPKVIINDDKTIFTSRKRRIVVTGLVVTTDRKISLGREKKRHIRGLLHRFSENRLDNDKISYLKGYLSYCSGSEPEFIVALRRKYGDLLLENVFKTPIFMRKIVIPKRK